METARSAARFSFLLPRWLSLLDWLRWKVLLDLGFRLDTYYVGNCYPLTGPSCLWFLDIGSTKCCPFFLFVLVVAPGCLAWIFGKVLLSSGF